MKLVCDACGAKYSIGDDRVAGKVFKIRCKKCSQVMVVRGAATVEAPVEPAPEPASDQWYAVVDGEQAGPMARAALMAKRAAGAIDDDTFVWREGMDEWIAYATLEELRESTRVEPAPVPVEDLFARATVSEDAPVEMSATTPKADAELKLRGERNENSVLFTLGNLAKLASPQPVKAAGAATAGGTEGSGLIDIRALAGTFAPARAAVASSRGSDDDLPAFGPVGFDNAPIVMMPIPSRRPDRKLMYALMATLAMLAILGTVLVLVVMRDKEAVASTPPGPQLAAIGPPPVAPAPPPTPAPAPVAPKVEAVAPTPPPRAPVPAVRTPAPSVARTPAPQTTSTRPVTPKPVLAIKEPEKQECTEVHCAYSSYAEKCCEIFKPKGTTGQAQSTLPENLDKDALKAGIATIRAQACGGKSNARGDVSVSVKINAAGGVSAVTIKSSPDPVLSSCVTAAAEKGSFAKTKRGGSFSYVWRF